MKKTLTTLSVLAVGLLGSTLLCETAQAVPIRGSIAFSAQWKTPGTKNFNNATTISFNTVKVYENSTYGTYSNVGIDAGPYETSGTPVSTFGPISLIPVSTSLDPLFSFKIGSTTYSFNATTVTKDIPLGSNGSVMALFGTGTASITGYDDTPGVWHISVSRALASINFESTAAVGNLPDGGLTMAFLGVAFLGLDGLRRKLVK